MNTSQIISSIQQVIGDSKRCSLHEPHFAGKEWDYIKECLDTGWVSSVGKYVDRFEQDLAEYTGAKHAIAVVNGTAALHICYLLSQIMRDDEVLMPSLSFVATANALAYLGAVPHFVDVESNSLGVCPEKLDQYLADIGRINNGVCINQQTGRPIKALCVVHIFGHPADLESLQAVCDKYHIKLIEDAAEGLGSFYKHKHIGTFGAINALSFNGNKIITTGGGGAILTDDDDLAAQAKHITRTAKIPHTWEYHHDQVGYNYRMPNINAALGCAQLERMTEILERKRGLAQQYIEKLTELDGLTVMQEPSYARSNYWLNAILVNKADRDSLITSLNENGIGVRGVWGLMSDFPMYQGCPKMPLPMSEQMAASVINLPSSEFLGRGIK